LNVIANLALALLIFGLASQEEDTATEKVARLADEIGQAVMAEDYEKITDLTYPKVIEKFGGRDEMIAETSKLMKSLEEQGYKFSSYKVSPPKEIIAHAGNQFAVVPTVIEMTFPKGKIVAKSYLLSISSDNGKTWTFIDGAALFVTSIVRLAPTASSISGVRASSLSSADSKTHGIPRGLPSSILTAMPTAG
jgi:hypothetical protein